MLFYLGILTVERYQIKTIRELCKCNIVELKKIKDLGCIDAIEFCDPTINTIIHENIKTTIVRSAVARSESVFLIPHFAKIEVNPANTADKTAAVIQSIEFPLCKNKYK